MNNKITTKEFQNNFSQLRCLVSKLFKYLVSAIADDDKCLNTNQVMTLLALRKKGPASMGNLFHHSRLTKGALTQIIDTYEEKGLVTRVRTKEDRRSVIVSLTEPGLELADKLEAKMEKQLDILLNKLEEEEKNELSNSIKNVTRIITKMERY